MDNPLKSTSAIQSSDHHRSMTSLQGLLLLPLLILASFLLANDSSEATCLEELKKEIDKKFFRKKHSAYGLYKILKGARNILPSYEILNLNASFENREKEIQHLRTTVLNKIPRKDKVDFHAAVDFYHGYSPIHRYQGSSFFKTLIAINFYNDNLCTEGKIPSYEDLTAGIQDVYDGLFGPKAKRQEVIQSYLLNLGNRSKDITTICQHDDDLIQLGKHYLDLEKSVRHVERVEADKDQEACPICFCDYDDETLPVSSECGHKACLNCLKQHIKAKAESKSTSVACVHPECKRPLHITDRVFTTGLDSATIYQMEEMLLKQMQGALYLDKRFVKCHNQHCTNFFKKIDKDDDRMLTCGECRKKTCLLCGNFHQEVCPIKAKEVQEKTARADEEMRKKGYMDCPFCGTWAQRESGCAYVTCANCRNHYDFITGGPWNAESEYRQRAFNRGHHNAERTSAKVIKDQSLIKDRNVYKGQDKW